MCACVLGGGAWHGLSECYRLRDRHCWRVHHAVDTHGMVAVQVDKYQGSQNDYILLSLVRTKHVGHLRDVRRLIVAMSRARLGLYVFGRVSLFKECHELKPVLDVMLKRPTRLALYYDEVYGATTRACEDVASKVPFVVRDMPQMTRYVYDATARRVQGAALEAPAAAPDDDADATAAPNVDDDDNDSDGDDDDEVEEGEVVDGDEDQEVEDGEVVDGEYDEDGDVEGDVDGEDGGEDEGEDEEQDSDPDQEDAPALTDNGAMEDVEGAAAGVDSATTVDTQHDATSTEARTKRAAPTTDDVDGAAPVEGQATVAAVPEEDGAAAKRRRVEETTPPSTSEEAVPDQTGTVGDTPSGTAPVAEEERAATPPAVEATPTLDPTKLKVVELREELEKRGLDTKGLKKVLVKRLSSALE